MTQSETASEREVRPFAPDFQETAPEVYHRLREEAPVYEVPDANLVLVTRYDLIRPLVRETGRFSSRFGAPSEQYKGSVASEIAEIASESFPYVPVMLTNDPPEHTRYRGTVAAYYTPRRIEQLRPSLVEIADRLIDAFPVHEPFDAVSAYAIPLPIEAIATVLQLPKERLADFKRWSDDCVVGTGATPSDERLVESARGIAEFQKFFVPQFERRRQEPQDDLMSDLVQAEVETDELDDNGEPVKRHLDMAELLAMLRQMLAAGNETSTNALAEGIRLLAEHQDEWRKLKADPGRAPLVVEEVLRLASPVAGMYRVATADTELGGCPIHGGSRVVPIFGAANRDPAVFRDPDAFCPGRPNAGEHLAFGKGIHFCLGAPLARLELTVGFERLARRLDTLELVPGQQLEFHPSFLLRGLKRLEIVVTKT